MNVMKKERGFVEKGSQKLSGKKEQVVWRRKDEKIVMAEKV